MSVPVDAIGQTPYICNGCVEILLGEETPVSHEARPYEVLLKDLDQYCDLLATTFKASQQVANSEALRSSLSNIVGAINATTQQLEQMSMSQMDALRVQLRLRKLYTKLEKSGFDADARLLGVIKLNIQLRTPVPV